MARIVIVESKEEDRLLLRNILESAGHDTYETQDLEQLLEYSRAGIDVIFTALQMPNTHGLELIMAVRAEAPDVAVMAVSSTGPDQLAMAEALGAAKSFRKPLDPQAILSAVAEVVGDGAG